MDQHARAAGETPTASNNSPLNVIEARLASGPYLLVGRTLVIDSRLTAAERLDAAAWALRQIPG